MKHYDWTAVANHLDAHGWAALPALMTRDETEALAALYDDDALFRSRVIMARHGFGRGEYKYFTYPLPDLISETRAALYPRLVPIANRWNEAMGIEVRYPSAHADFIARCPVPATMLSDVVCIPLHFLARVGNSNGKTAIPHHWQIDDVIPHETGFLRGGIGGGQNFFECSQFVLNALVHVLEFEIASPESHGFRDPLGDQAGF